MKIIILHGLYMHALVMSPLSKQLMASGYATETLSYNTVRINDNKVFRQIDQAIDSKGPNVLLGHSLGGLLIQHYLTSRQPDTEQISHVVTLGSPLKGASIVGRIQKMGLGKMLGNSILYGLELHQASWVFPQKLGSIAGTLPLGFRPVLMGNRPLSDGTVTVEETHIEGMTDHIELHYSHMSLLYNRLVARQIRHFIEHDCFMKKVR